METLLQSNTALIGDFGRKPSGKSYDSFIEQMDVGIIENHGSKLLDQNDRSDFILEDTDKIDNGYSRVETKNKIDNKNQIVNMEKLLEQLCNSKVVLERLPDSIISEKLRPTGRFKLDIKNKNTYIVNLKSGAKTMMKRYCSICKVVEPNVNISTGKPCIKCGNPLYFQCVYCYKVYTAYSTLLTHLKISCSLRKGSVRTSNIRHKCNKCSFETCYESSLRRHSVLHQTLDKDNISTDAKAVDVPSYKTMMTRYCRKCEVVEPNSKKTGAKELCTKCGTPLHYQCLNCHSVFTMYPSLYKHLKVSCSLREEIKTDNIRHQCEKCSFESRYKSNLRRHFILYHTSYQDSIPTDIRAVDVPSSKTMITRYCRKCEVVKPNSNKAGSEESCRKCGTPLHYQCFNCYSVFATYQNLCWHVRTSCKTSNFAASSILYKCNKCLFMSSFERSLKRHLIVYHSSDKGENEDNI